jgi:hypothetical protein
MTAELAISLAGILVNVFGFFFVIRQIRMQALATRGETYTSLCGLSYDILQMIADKPMLYDYVYGSRRLNEHCPAEKRVPVLICCEMIANYCDNVALQRENIPDAIWQRWRTFIREQIVTCPELYSFLRANTAWYSPDLIQILDELPVIV